MSFLEFSNIIKQIATEIDNNREEESIIIAEETIALIRLRVQNEKVDAEGDSFGEYSLQYELFRVANNQPVDAKNYTFTGDMWRDTGITEVDNTGFTTTVTIGGQTAEAAAKMAGNTLRDGPILQASEEEIEFIIEAHTERIFGIINKFFT